MGIKRRREDEKNRNKTPQEWKTKAKRRKTYIVTELTTAAERDENVDKYRKENVRELNARKREMKTNAV